MKSPNGSRFEEIQKTYDLAGLQVAVSVDDSLIFVWEGGEADPESKRPMQRSTKMRVASQTKMVTTLAVLALVQDGKLDLDADISQYLGFSIRNPHVPYEKITLQELLTHTSSLRDGPEYDRFIVQSLQKSGKNPIRDFLSADADSVWAAHVPGTYFAYCNLGYVVAGTIVESASGERFDRFIRQRLLLPLGIAASTNVSDFDAPEALGVLVRKVNGRWLPQHDAYPEGLPSETRFDGYIPGTNALPFGAQGGLRISALDMLNVVNLIRRNGRYGNVQLIDSALVARMRTPIWRRDGTNGGDGEKYGGQFAAWGLGMHHAGYQPSDAMIPGAIWTGHPGEAYGLLSGGYTDGRRSMVFILNGMGGAWEKGPQTGYYAAEEALYNAINDVFTGQGF